MYSDADHGGQCLAQATHEHDGRPVCWIHYSACSGPRTVSPGRYMGNGRRSPGPVQFVKRPKRLSG